MLSSTRKLCFNDGVDSRVTPIKRTRLAAFAGLLSLPIRRYSLST